MKEPRRICERLVKRCRKTETGRIIAYSERLTPIHRWTASMREVTNTRSQESEGFRDLLVTDLRRFSHPTINVSVQSVWRNRLTKYFILVNSH